MLSTGIQDVDILLGPYTIVGSQMCGENVKGEIAGASPSLDFVVNDVGFHVIHPPQWTTLGVM